MTAPSAPTRPDVTSPVVAAWRAYVCHAASCPDIDGCDELKRLDGLHARAVIAARETEWGQG